MSTLHRRVADLESRRHLRPEDEACARVELAWRVLQKEDYQLFQFYLDAIETAEHLTLESAMKHATTGEELRACKRLQELEALPIEELKTRAAA